MDNISKLIEDLEIYIEDSKKALLSNNIVVDKEVIFKFIEDIRLNIPSEIKQAQRLVDNCDKIINEANMKATSIIKNAEEKAEKLTMEHEITKMAKEQAEIIMEEANVTSKSIRLGAVKYADEIIENAENSIKETLDIFVKQASQVEDYLTKISDELYENRLELRETDNN